MVATMVFDEFLIKSLINRFNDWPKNGLSYIDLSQIVANPKAFRMVVDALVHNYIDSNINRIVAIETNALPFASAVAYSLNIPLSCIRKYERTPELWLKEEHSGVNFDALYLKKDECKSTDNVLLFDDVIASGSTVSTASALIRRSEATITEICCIVALPDSGAISQVQGLNINLFPLVSL
jgi:adenine phosphoribosyltransferase